MKHIESQLEIYQKIIAKQAEIMELFEQLHTFYPELPTPKKQSKRFEIPTLNELSEYISLMGYSVNPEQFHAFYSSKNWMIGKNKMKCWKSALITWNIKAKRANDKTKNGNPVNWSDKNSTFFDSLMSEDF